MKCSFCGCDNPDGKYYCSFCGHKYDTAFSDVLNDNNINIGINENYPQNDNQVFSQQNSQNAFNQNSAIPFQPEFDMRYNRNQINGNTPPTYMFFGGDPLTDIYIQRNKNSSTGVVGFVLTMIAAFFFVLLLSAIFSSVRNQNTLIREIIILFFLFISDIIGLAFSARAYTKALNMAVKPSPLYKIGAISGAVLFILSWILIIIFL